MPLPKRILIANRGTAATRIMRCCQKLGIPYVTVYSVEDCDSLHVDSTSVCLHEDSSKALDTYLNWDTLFKICADKQCDAIHPGYGFLSENAEFARECAKRGINFIGPTPEQIEAFGLKHSARALAETHHVPLLPGTGLLRDIEHAKTEAVKIGYPVLLKCIAGGGGIGMKICESEGELIAGFDAVKRLAKSAFKDDGVFLEKFLARARHVEVQIFGDGRGNVVALGERDCSTQRRNQKIIEESPAPYLNEDVRARLWASAVRLAKGVGYRSAGTVEYVVDAATQEFYFLEVNTRVQVEHGVTEQVYSEAGTRELDIIEWMILTSGGELDLSTFPSLGLQPKYHSIQCRIYAEDVNKDYQPSSGVLTQVGFPAASSDVRIETWVKTGTKVSASYDPMIAKLIVRGKTREEARLRMVATLQATRISGLECNLEFLENVMTSREFATFKDCLVHTHWLKSFKYIPRTIDVLDPGTQTSVQDYPGRIGYWAPGVPPSGPMDHLAFRVANRLVGNEEGAAGLEMTLQGATLQFNSDCNIALAGAEMDGDLDGKPIKFWETMPIKRRQVLRLKSTLNGCRTYLAVSGAGLDIPSYLGSKSTFALGKFGGHAGRTLISGDVLHLSRNGSATSSSPIMKICRSPPLYPSKWNLHVVLGPHASPDFFTSEFITNEFFSSEWTVHYNSNRLGIRLSGPKPAFSREDGGEAGLHPSNIHDTVYAIGTVNFTGDMPVILGLDGPSLGGFVCPVTIVKADLWKIGQVRPGDRIQFELTTYKSAVEMELQLDEWIAKDQFAVNGLGDNYEACDVSSTSAVLKTIQVDGIQVVYRLAGDHNVLIEYGPFVLDLRFRCRVHALMTYLEANPIQGVIELSPGVRSIQIHFDSRVIGTDISTLLSSLEAAERSLEKIDEMKIPSRVIHLPLAFEASSTITAINKYRQSVREKAPWLPSNIEFIRRINGLDSVETVSDTVYDSSYLVLGLGDVYLGAPCAVPLDPRHRLMTTKYNPARTWTEEGEVGIGGVFMCIYGMQSPGGYQLVGRTVPIWNNFPKSKGKVNWVLKSFDQVRFYPVTENELMSIRSRLNRGDDCLDAIRVEEDVFVVKDYLKFLEMNQSDIAEFQAKQLEAFKKERDSWTKDDEYNSSLDKSNEHGGSSQHGDEIKLSANEVPIKSQLAGNIWSVNVKPGETVEKGQVIVVVEAMKLEINIQAPFNGTVHSVYVKPGSKCAHGDLLMTFVKEEPVDEASNGKKLSQTPSNSPRQAINLTDLSIESLHRLYFPRRSSTSRGEAISVYSVMETLLSNIKSTPHPHIFITTRDDEDVLKQAAVLDALPENVKRQMPLFGIPFACKDNIDCAGLPTTCACPEFTYTPVEDATVVRLLKQAGAVLLGKTNMDQFAAGLVGARSPYGACRSVFNSEYVSGGSSSGSAVAVGARLATFSLGTDTAGSGRVPAMNNKLVGLKPTRGLFSIKGVVPACQSLDCVSIFATSLETAGRVKRVLAQFDPLDAYSRPSPLPPTLSASSEFVFAIPDKLEFFGDELGPIAFKRAVDRLEAMGGRCVPIDFSVFSKTANLLYYGPWVAERLEAIEAFVKTKANSMHPVTRSILTRGADYSAVDTFRALHELESLKRQAVRALEGISCMVVPTAPRHYKLSEVEKDPVQLNTNLGTYTNFVNLLDLSALAVPLGEDRFDSRDKMPYGITLIGRCFEDDVLLDIAHRFERSLPVDLAVVGAHLSGMPLNYQLTERNATFVRSAYTAKGKYRLYALNELKPGLVRVENSNDEDDKFQQCQIRVEIWRFPSLDGFGKFVAEIPSPLGVGTIEVDDVTGNGVEQVKSFLCESYAVKGARDISRYGGWREFKSDLNKV